MVDFIRSNKDLYGVDAICRILPIATSTYYRALDLALLDVLGFRRDLESGNRLRVRSVKFYKSPRLRTALYYYG